MANTSSPFLNNTFIQIMANELNSSRKFARSLKTYGYMEYRPNPNEMSVVIIIERLSKEMIG